MQAIAYPFRRLFGDIVLTIDQMLVDGEPIPILAFDQDSFTVSVFSLKREHWNECELRIRVELPIQEIRSEEFEESKLQVMVRVNCDETKLRITDLPKLVDGACTSTLTIKRRNMSSHATLEAFAIYGGDDGVPRILKDAAKWRLLFERPATHESLLGRRKTKVREFVEIKWLDFSSPDHSYTILREYKTEAYFVDVQNVPPVLFLNEGIPGYRVLLTERRGAGRAEVALRDLEYQRLALAVWIAAAYQSLSKIVKDDDGEIQWPLDWSRNVLDRLVREMYPSDPTDAGLRKLFEMSGSEGNAGFFSGLLQVAINRIIASSATMRKHLANLIEGT